MSEEKHLLPESWDELEHLLKQKADEALERLEQSRQRLDSATQNWKTVTQESAREAAQTALREAKEAWKLARSDWMRKKIEVSIANVRSEAEGRVQQFADRLERRREQEVEKTVQALRKRLLARDEQELEARRAKEAGRVEISVERLLSRLDRIEKKTEETVPVASIALHWSRQVGVENLARRAARQADEISDEFNKTLREVLPKPPKQQWDTRFPEDEEDPPTDD